MLHVFIVYILQAKYWTLLARTNASITEKTFENTLKYCEALWLLHFHQKLYITHIWEWKPNSDWPVLCLISYCFSPSPVFIDIPGFICKFQQEQAVNGKLIKLLAIPDNILFTSSPLLLKIYKTWLHMFYNFRRTLFVGQLQSFFFP